MYNANEPMLENVIVLRAVYGKVNQTYHINPCKNPKTGMYPPCVRRVDKFGDLVLSEEDKSSGNIFISEKESIVVQDGTVFDLNNPLQAARWEAIKNCVLIAPDRDARDKQGNLLIDGTLKHDGRAVLYVEHPGRSTEIKMNKARLLNKAMNLVFTDSIDGLKTKCRLLGKKMDNAYPADIEDFMSEFAKRNPQKIIDLYTGTDTDVRMLLIEAIEHGVIHERQGMYMYGDKIYLGPTDDSAIAWLKDPTNRRIRQYIVEETYPELHKKTTTTEESAEEGGTEGAAEPKKETKTVSKKK